MLLIQLLSGGNQTDHVKKFKALGVQGRGGSVGGSQF